MDDVSQSSGSPRLKGPRTSWQKTASSSAASTKAKRFRNRILAL